MALRDALSGELIKMDVVMKDGREFIGCDVPPKPQGETELVVGFWLDDNVLRMVPLQDVLHVDYYKSPSL